MHSYFFLKALGRLFWGCIYSHMVPLWLVPIEVSMCNPRDGCSSFLAYLHMPLLCSAHWWMQRNGRCAQVSWLTSAEHALSRNGMRPSQRDHSSTKLASLATSAKASSLERWTVYLLPRILSLQMHPLIKLILGKKWLILVWQDPMALFDTLTPLIRVAAGLWPVCLRVALSICSPLTNVSWVYDLLAYCALAGTLEGWSCVMIEESACKQDRGGHSCKPKFQFASKMLAWFSSFPLHL